MTPGYRLHSRGGNALRVDALVVSLLMAAYPVHGGGDLSIEGSLEDSNGRPVSQYSILLRVGPTKALKVQKEPQSKIVVTDFIGAFRITNLAPGAYVISPLGNDSLAKEIDLSGGPAAEPVKFRLPYPIQVQFSRELDSLLKDSVKLVINPEAAKMLNLQAAATLNASAARTLNPLAAATLNPGAAATINAEASRTINPEAAATINPEAAATINAEAAAAINSDAARTINPQAATVLNPEVAAVLDSALARVLTAEQAKTLTVDEAKIHP